MIDLHYVPTFNGQKIALMLEETGLEYRIRPYNVLAGEHLTAEFHALNPNHKLPVIVDDNPSVGGGPLVVFETGAILMYLAEKTSRFLPMDFRRREAARQWLIWQVSGLGPMHGQANHFLRYAPSGQDYAKTRYLKEARRLLYVMESRLKTEEYLAGEYSIADIACWPLISVVHTIGIDIEDYPSILRWRLAIDRRPAAVRVAGSAQTATPPSLLKGEMKLTDEQWDNVFGDRMHAAAQGS